MFGYREAATDWAEQGTLIERVEPLFCDFTSLSAPTEIRSPAAFFDDSVVTRYSYLSATIGSTCAARRAGM
jgi:hypothetical protein